MLQNVSHVYEETISAHPLTVLIGLSFEEDHLLTELGAQAKALAPILGEALSDLIQQVAGSHTSYQLNSKDLPLYLQDWFLQLFQSRDDAYIKSFKTLGRVHLHLLLTGIDLILAYGHEITQCSSNPEGATRAFHKALSLKIASEQLQSQVDAAQHLYAMMLLD